MNKGMIKMDMEMDFDCEKKHIVDIDGFIESGKQFDLEINLDEDHRNVIFGVIKDSCNEPVKDAVVKLLDLTKHERKPVSHTFTNKDGEFVFGPLCSDKRYAIDIWANRVEHVKICKHCRKEGKCLKGVKLDCKHDFTCNKPCEDKCEDKCEKKCEEICKEL